MLSKWHQCELYIWDNYDLIIKWEVHSDFQDFGPSEPDDSGAVDALNIHKLFVTKE